MERAFSQKQAVIQPIARIASGSSRRPLTPVSLGFIGWTFKLMPITRTSPATIAPSLGNHLREVALVTVTGVSHMVALRPVLRKTTPQDGFPSGFLEIP